MRWVRKQLVSIFVDNELGHVGSHETLWHAMLIIVVRHSVAHLYGSQYGAHSRNQYWAALLKMCFT